MQYNETMAVSGRFAAVACVALAAACSPFGGGEFVCMQDDQCQGGPGGGMCEADGRCSFPDPACSTGRRYGGFAGTKSNTCVGGGSGIDAPFDPDAPDAPFDSSIDSPMSTPFCDPSNATLVGCWQFEGNGIDGSGSNPTNTANTASGTFGTGKVGMGLTLTASSLITVGDRASLEPPNLTVEAWIRPTALPAAGLRMGIVDSGGAYGIFLNNGGILCSMSIAVQTTFAFPLNAWTHIACTTDGATVRMYIDGVQVNMLAGAAPLGVGDTLGVVLAGNSPSGEPLIGTIDQMRMWNVARTAGQICVAAGLTNCP